MRQPNWDQYEAALLIEAYCKIKENRSSRKTVIAELSATLRTRAEKHGIAIDETYRNENGISMRLGELDYLFSGDGVGLKNTSDLFRQMVQLFTKDNIEFEKILMEAKGMSGNVENVRQHFREWLIINAPKTQPDSVCRSLSVAEEFCLKIKVLSTPLFETTDVATVKRFAKTVSQNKIFRIKCKKQINSIVSAADWYYAFVRALPAIQHTKNNIEKASVTFVEARNLAIVDFDALQSLAFTKPVALIYRGYRDESISTWTDLYVKLVSRLYNDYSSSIPVGKSFTGSGRIDLGNKEIARSMASPKPIFMQIYLETNLSATNIVGKIKALLDICNIDYGEVVIEYQKKPSDIVSDDVAQRQGGAFATVGKGDTIAFSEWLRIIAFLRSLWYMFVLPEGGDANGWTAGSAV